MQDIKFITADPEHARAFKSRGEETRTRRNKDGAWTQKYSKSSFGYKLQIRTDNDFGLIK